MRVVTSYQNFARAKLDHDFQGRFDLPIYQTGADEYRNFLSNFKGNAIYRPGFELMLIFEDCAFVEYKFSNNQNYILVLYNLKMRFLSYDANGNFGWVLSGGNPYEIDTPWSLAEAKEIAFKKSVTQNFDTMILCHKDHEPRKLTRISAASFTLLKYSRKDDPFPLTWDSTKTITAVTQAANAQVTSAAHGYSVGDRVLIAGIAGMTQLNGWTANVLTVPTANTFTIDVATTSFTAYSSGGTAAKVLTGDYPSVALFYKGRLAYAASRLKITTVWMSESGQYYIHTLPASVTDASALQFTIAEISQAIEWLTPGSNSLIAGAADGIIAINGGAVGEPITSATVEANITPADGCNSAAPLQKDGLIFYVGQNSRNVYYFNYDILTESFISDDANIVSYDLSHDGFSKIRFVKDRNDLVFCLRGDGALCSMNFNAREKIIGWHENFTSQIFGMFTDIAQISDNDGNQQLFALVKRGTLYYIERQAPLVEFAKRSDFFTQPAGQTQTERAAAKTLDDDAYHRYVAEQLKQSIYLDNSTTFSDLRTSTVTYNSAGGGTVTAGASAFTADDVGKHIVYKTLTGYESGRLEISAFSSSTLVEVDVLQTLTSSAYSNWYMTFDTITDSVFGRFNGANVSVVTDGGYLDDYIVAGSAITLPQQVTHAVAGYKYRGVIKSFPLGFQVQGENTQTTMKAVSRVGLRAVASVGGKFGTTPYRLEPVQELTQGNLNYLPPPPIDGTKYINYSDDHEEDKCFYIIQDEPGPLRVCAVMVDASYAFTR